MWLLSQLDHEEALVQGYWHLLLIGLVGFLAVMLLVLMFLGRRWKRRQLLAIERDRAARRAAHAAERVDAWQASSDRYIDHDKLPPDALGPGDDALDDEDEDEPEDDLREPDDTDDTDDPEQDPYDLFTDQPYRDTDDEDDDMDDFDEDREDFDEEDLDDEGPDDDWDEDDEPQDKPQ